VNELREILDQMKTEEPREPMSDAEHKARAVVLFALFSIKGASDQVEQAKAYLEATEEIPFDFLVRAVRAQIRKHVYPGVPSPADIWRDARYFAGMHRERYCPPHDGLPSGYAKPPTKWPPAGMSYGACVGEFETLAKLTGGLLERQPVKLFLLEAGEKEQRR
jgi:hypothetical protein